MSDDSIPGPTPTGYQRTQGGGVKWVPPTAEHLGKLLPQYDIECILGFGGMGAVYKGKQKSLDRTVAIKILPPGLEDEDASYVDRFKNEARIMAKLDHPAIVPVYDFGETTEGQLYIVMSFVDGTDVQKMLQQQGRLPSEHALAVTAHVCDALKYAHEHGVIHRDIKPANILINMDGAVKVADFGLAKADEAGSSGITKTGMAMGTPDYVAPEALVMGVNVDGRADLYAVGVMLYAMLTGNVPRGAFKPASVQVPGTDPRFDKIVQKAMQMDRDERYQSAAEIRRDLDVILTTPLVQAGGQSSAAIPKAAIAQKPVAKGPQKPMGKSANVPVRKEAAAAPAPNPQSEIAHPKSKAPLFIGIGAVAAIAVGAFVMMGGKKPDVGDDVRSLTSSSAASEQQRLVTSSPTPAAPIKVREDPKPASSVSASLSAKASTSPPLPVSSSSAQFPPGQWVKVFTKFEDLPAEWRKQGVKLEDGWIRVGGKKGDFRLTPALNGNYGVRLTFIRQAKTNNLTIAPTAISVRMQEGGQNLYNVSLWGGSLAFNRRMNRSYEQIHTIACPKDPVLGDTASLGLAVVGKRLIGRFGEDMVTSISDDHLAQGTAKISGSEDFRDIEVINLDGIPEAEALKILGVDEKGNDLRQPAVASSNLKSPISTPAASSPAPSATAPVSSFPSLPVSKSSPAFPPGQWMKVFTKVEDLPEALRNPDSGVKFEDGWIAPGNQPLTLFYGELSGNDYVRKNQAVRLRAKWGDNNLTVPRIHVRHRKVGPGLSKCFMLSVDRDGYAILNYESVGEGKAKIVTLAKAQKQRMPLTLGQEYHLELAVVGNLLVGRLNDVVVVTVNHEDVEPGLAFYFRSQHPIRDIEVINLDGLPEAEALRILGVDEKGNDLRALAAKQEQQMAEQAKAVDAMAAIPELKTLHEQFVKLQAERVTAPFAADVAKLNAGYLGGLDREIEKEKNAGHLDGVIVLEAEKKLIPLVGRLGETAGAVVGRLGETAGGDSQSRPTIATMPIPAEDDDATPANLKGLRKIYRDAFAKLEATRAANLKLLTDPLSIRLKQLESTLTQKNRVPDAKTVREYREGLGRADGPPSAANALPGANTSKTALAGASALPGKAPLKKFQPGDDRKAAEWVLDLGGRITILDGRTPVSVDNKEDLPKRSFAIQSIDLNAETADNRAAAFTDLGPLTGLRKLEVLGVNRFAVADADIDVLASLSELRRLSFTNCAAFTGEGLARLKVFSNLDYLAFSGSGIGQQGLKEISEFSQLNFLRLSSCKVGNTDLAPLQVLKKLTGLMLTKTKVTPEGWRQFKELPLVNTGFSIPAAGGDAWCKELASMFPLVKQAEVNIDDGQCTADVTASLAAFPNLSEISFSSPFCDDAAFEGFSRIDKLSVFSLRAAGGGLPNLTDAGIGHLVRLKLLNKLHLDDADSITPAALMTLTKLKSLKTLGIVKCAQLDDAAIAAFQKARPDVTVTR